MQERGFDAGGDIGGGDIGRKVGRDRLAGLGAQSTQEPSRLAVLAYADAMTITGADVDDALFARVHEYFDDDAMVELTATFAWENASSKFNRALRVPAQGLWQRQAITE